MGVGIFASCEKRQCGKTLRLGQVSGRKMSGILVLGDKELEWSMREAGVLRTSVRPELVRKVGLLIVDVFESDRVAQWSFKESCDRL